MVTCFSGVVRALTTGFAGSRARCLRDNAVELSVVVRKLLFGIFGTCNVQKMLVRGSDFQGLLPVRSWLGLQSAHAVESEMKESKFCKSRGREKTLMSVSRNVMGQLSHKKRRSLPRIGADE